MLRGTPACITLVGLTVLLVAASGCDSGEQAQTQAAAQQTDQTTVPTQTSVSTTPQTTAAKAEAIEETTTTVVGEEEVDANNTPSSTPSQTTPNPTTSPTSEQPPAQTPKASGESAPSEIAVTGVVTYQGAKADGTPVYGIKDEATQQGYFLEGAGDFSAYLGQRVIAYGTSRSGGGARVLDVSRVEVQPSQ